MKKTALISLFALLISYCSTLHAQNVVVILSKSMSVQDMMYKRFEKELKKHHDVNIHKFILGEDTELKLSQDKEIMSLSPSAIFSIGTQATHYAKGFKNTFKVFTLVVNPVKESFCTKEGKSTGNMTGVFISISPYEQFKLIKEALPNAKRIGVVYDPTKSENTINQAIPAAKKLNMEIIIAPVTNRAKVIEKFENLAGKIDVLWSVVDNTVYNKNSFESILLFSLRNKIPFFGFSEHQVKAGALMSIYCDYPSLGAQAAEIVSEILSGKNIGNIPPQNPKIIKYAISERASTIMGIKIPAKLRMGADKILSDSILKRFYAKTIGLGRTTILLSLIK